MTCSIKVAHRDGMDMVTMGDAHYNSEDGQAVIEMCENILTSFHNFQKKLSEQTDDAKTPRAVRSVTRAMRFDSWAYVRMKARGRVDKKTKKYGVEFSIETNNPNNAEKSVYESTKCLAVRLAEVIYVKWLQASDELKERIRFDLENEYFKTAKELIDGERAA